MYKSQNHNWTNERKFQKDLYVLLPFGDNLKIWNKQNIVHACAVHLTNHQYWIPVPIDRGSFWVEGSRSLDCINLIIVVNFFKFMIKDYII